MAKFLSAFMKTIVVLGLIAALVFIVWILQAMVGWVVAVSIMIASSAVAFFISFLKKWT